MTSSRLTRDYVRMAKRKRRARVQLGVPTTKDFVAVSKILCRHGASDSMTRDFAALFASQNPRFDSERFVAATKKC